MITIILLIITYAFNLIDYWQTIYAIQHFGINVELNPIMRLLFENDCMWVKLIVPIILLVALGLIVKIERGQTWAIYVLLVLYFLSIMHNFAMLMQMGAFSQMEDELMTTVAITCAITSAVLAMIVGVLCAYIKHLKKK